jgi:nucleotide-binding universal stress UspA family protein
MSGMPMPGLERTPNAESEDEKAKLVRWQTAIAQEGAKVTLHEPTGQAAEEILSQADAVNADLIVMGKHGHGAMYDLLVGSATKGVLKHSTRPVLLVPAPKS